mgnify:CR=1 FL=1
MLAEEKEFSACMKQLKDQISNLSVSKSQKKCTLTALSDLTSSLKITNVDLKYQLLHGAAFKDMLDARDQVLEH